MAKMKNKKNNMSTRGQSTSRGGEREEFGADQYDAGDDTDSSEDTEETNMQAAGSRQSNQTNQKSQGQSRQVSAKSAKNPLQDFDPGQLLDSARSFVEGHPGRATLIGAAVGAAVAGLFATERGRQLVSAAYSYGRPMIADYARNFINSSSGDAVDRILPQ